MLAFQVMSEALYYRLQRALRTPICLDECIRSARHAGQAIRLRACGFINLSNFNRQFQRIKRMTPREFGRQLNRPSAIFHAVPACIREMLVRSKQCQKVTGLHEST